MHNRRFDPSKMAKLDDPKRKKVLTPETLISELQIKENDDVLDLGAGTGYFAIPVAQWTKGKVYALDVEPQMLDVLKERAEQKDLQNICYVEGTIENIPLKEEVADFVIASMVLHEVEPLSKGLQEIYRTLKPGGKCLCLEWEKKPMELGPPLEHRIDSIDLEKAMSAEGFNVLSSYSPTVNHYIIIIQK